MPVFAADGLQLLLSQQYTLTLAFVGGVSVLGLLLLLAIRRKIKRPPMQLLGIVLTWFDFATDLMFVTTLRDTEDAVIEMLGIVAQAWLVLVSLSSLAFVVHILRSAARQEAAEGTGSSPIDFEQLSKLPALYGGMVLMSSANTSLLVLLPWRHPKRDLGGFPTAQTLWLVVGLSSAEAIGQAALNIIYLNLPHPHTAVSSAIAFLSLSFSLTSLMWRVLRKLLGSLAHHASSTRSRKLLGSIGSLESTRPRLIQHRMMPSEKDMVPRSRAAADERVRCVLASEGLPEDLRQAVQEAVAVRKETEAAHREALAREKAAIAARKEAESAHREAEDKEQVAVDVAVAAGCTRRPCTNVLVRIKANMRV